MKKIIVSAIAILSVLMLVSLYPTRPVQANGTRSDLDITFYTNPDTAFTALQADEVDMVQWALTKEQKDAVELNPNLQIGQFVENGMMEYDFQNNYTIADYPTTRNPMNIKEVRVAVDYLVDEDYIITNILKNMASRIDVSVCYPQYPGWVDPSVVTYDWNGDGIIQPSENKYPYLFSITNAVNTLAALGFSDTDLNGYLNYPTADYAGMDTTAMPLKMCIRSDDPNRLAAGRLLVAALEGNPGIAGDSALATSPRWAALGLVGGDFDTTDTAFEGPRAFLRPIVMGARNFHIYTGGWSFGRYPTYLFSLFHSMFFYPYGPNYVTGQLGTHPILDGYVRDIYYAANIADAQTASKLATKYIVENNVVRGLWSATSYVAWRKELAGVVNMKGVGSVNDWTFMNAWRTKTSNPLRFATVSGWTILNVMYAQWYFEYALLDRVYSGLINVNPYDLASDIPWGAQDWEVGTWVDPRDGNEKQAITYYLNKAQGCAAPVTGNLSGLFTAKDYVFTCWYNYAYDDDWQWSSFMDINHIETINDFTVKVYFDDVSMWFIYAPIYPLLGPAGYLEEKLCTPGVASFTGADLVEAPPDYFEYQFNPTDKVVQIISATCNGAPIYEGLDFYIRAGYDVFTHNVFVPMRPFEPGDVIVINYYAAIPNGAGGTYIGGNLGYDWTDTMYAYGYMYPVSISSTSAALNKNPFFFLETIPKGEIDFRWNWVAGAKPRDGYFKIDILDVVKCTGAYSTRGDGMYNALYLAGADLDDTDLCHIGILDLVTITGKYAMQWGHPVDDPVLCVNDVRNTVVTVTWPQLATAGARTVMYSAGLNIPAADLATGATVLTFNILPGNNFGVAAIRLSAGVRPIIIVYLGWFPAGKGPADLYFVSHAMKTPVAGGSCQWTWANVAGVPGLAPIWNWFENVVPAGGSAILCSPAAAPVFDAHFQWGLAVAKGHYFIAVG